MRLIAAIGRALRNRVLIGLLCGVALVFGGRWIINRTTLADWLVAPLLLADTQGRADVIVAMGAGVVGDCVPNLNGVRRVLYAARAVREGRAPLVLFTGGRGDGGCPVATAMAQFAREIHVPAGSILVETTSRTTRENAVLSASILRAHGLRRLLIVTDRLHMRRASGVFTRLGFDVERVSVPIYEGHVDNVSMLSSGIREMAALAYYRTRGWIGPAEPEDRAATTGHISSSVETSIQPSMTPQRKHPGGPIVVLGASYAAGWDLTTVGGVPIVNRGVAGQVTSQMMDRFEQDVVSTKPRAVIIWGFINDIFRAGAQEGDAARGRVVETYARMVQSARQQGIEPILATEVTVRTKDSWSETFAEWAGFVTGKRSLPGPHQPSRDCDQRVARRVGETRRIARARPSARARRAGRAAPARVHTGRRQPHHAGRLRRGDGLRQAGSRTTSFGAVGPAASVHEITQCRQPPASPLPRAAVANGSSGSSYRLAPFASRCCSWNWCFAFPCWPSAPTSIRRC